MQSQLTYCMLYLCESVYGADRSQLNDIVRQDLVLISMLALELSRFRTVAAKGTITAAEHSHLQNMETSVYNCLDLKPNASREVTELYLNALRSVGCEFYQGAYPLALLSTIMGLLFRQESELREKRQEDILQVCASFLLASPNPLEKFTITSYNSSNSVFDGE